MGALALGIVVPLGVSMPTAYASSGNTGTGTGNANGQPSNSSGPSSLSRGDVQSPAPAHDSDQKPWPIYSSCTQVRSLGVGPLYAGQPGYSRQLDPDGTGVACG